MIRIYCDLCEKELSIDEGCKNEFNFNIENKHVFAHFALDQIYHTGNICENCLKRIVNKGKVERTR